MEKTLSEIQNSREELLELALKSPLQEHLWKKLFEYDSQFLKKLSSAKRIEAQFALLLNDTAPIPRKSHTMLQICLLFTKYTYQSTHDISNVRHIFERLLEERIGVFFKLTYETWCTLELQAGNLEMAQSVLERSVKCNVLLKGEVEKVFQKLKSENYTAKCATDSEPTVMFVPSTTRTKKAQESDEEPTVTMNFKFHKRDSTGQLHREDVPLNTTKGKWTKGFQTKKVIPPKRTLGRLGGAVRVKNSDGAVRESFQSQLNSSQLTRVTEELDISSTSTTQGETNKGFQTKRPSAEEIRKKLGDMSYIMNWKPPDSSNDHNQEQRNNKILNIPVDGPTVSFKSRGEKSRFNKRSSTTSDSSIEGTPTVAFPKENLRRIDSDEQPLPSKLPTEDDGSIKLKMFSKKNIFSVNGRQYLRLSLIGRGGSSKVFKVLTLDEDEPMICALKRIKLQRVDKTSISPFKNEIKLLQSLKGIPNIIRIYDSEINYENKVIYVVMEHGEIDLNKLLNQQRRNEMTEKQDNLGIAMAGPLSLNFIRLTWMNMLLAVNAVHEERIVHGDLKPANFLFVKGKLKLIDFGIAKEIANDTVNIVRDTQVGTINFMSPEAIVGQNGADNALKVGRASDVWSLGCILYQMVYGHPPFHNMKIFEKLRAIPDDSHEISFPETNSTFLTCMKACLKREPKLRATIPELLKIWDTCLSHPADTQFSAKNPIREPLKPMRSSGLQLSELQAKRQLLKTTIKSNVPSISGLKQEIQQKKSLLKPLAESNSSMYMGAKPETPEHKKKELGYILRRGLEEKFENVVKNGDTPGKLDNTTNFTWNIE